MRDKLAEEEKKQQDHVKLVMARLEKDKETWFQGMNFIHFKCISVVNTVHTNCIVGYVC